ncbi:MAG: hypothetical protein ACRC26_00450 [Bacteroidales bacterium]
MIFKSTSKRGLLDEQSAIDLMSEMGYSLERLSKVVDLEMFRPLLEDKLIPKVRKHHGGARPFDCAMMFKILVLQRLFGLTHARGMIGLINRTYNLGRFEQLMRVKTT